MSAIREEAGVITLCVGAIITEFSCECDENCRHGSGAVSLALIYSDSQPFQVTLTINDDIATHWVFARDLLRDATSSLSASGLGDVHCWTGGNDRFFIKMSNGMASATLSMYAGNIRQFVTKIYDLMPDDNACMSMDVIIHQILESDSY